MPITKADIDTKPFDDLPTFDARAFEPPSWAKEKFGSDSWAKNGESSSKGTQQPSQRKRSGVDVEGSRGPNRNGNGSGSGGASGDETLVNNDSDDGEEEEEVWEDAKSDVDPDEAKFTLSDLKELLSRALRYKETGNKAFTSKPAKHEEAVQSYLSAIDHLPNIPSPSTADSKLDSKTTADSNSKSESSIQAVHNGDGAGGSAGESGIVEVTDDEAAQIEAAEVEKDNEANSEEVERKEVEDEIKDTTRACWGNLAACYIALGEDQKAVDACTEALKIDPRFVKGLHRRATANERIGSLTALSSSKDDYTLLLSLLPPSSPLIPTIRRSLFTLPERIKVAEKEQMDEMMGKLKNLGNMFLGNFGLSTDNFKFEQGEGGGYNMQFQR